MHDGTPEDDGVQFRKVAGGGRFAYAATLRGRPRFSTSRSVTGRNEQGSCARSGETGEALQPGQLESLEPPAAPPVTRAAGPASCGEARRRVRDAPRANAAALPMERRGPRRERQSNTLREDARSFMAGPTSLHDGLHVREDPEKLWCS